MSSKEFFLFRFIKRVFFTGFINILPTLLVISILVIAFNFLDNNLGGPINLLIKKQLAGNWRNFAIDFLEIDPALYEPEKQETYEELVLRVQKSSPLFIEAKGNYETSKEKFNELALEKLKSRATATDPNYIEWLDKELLKAKEETGLISAEETLRKEEVRIREVISRENETRIENLKWKGGKKQRLLDQIDDKYPPIIGLLLAVLAIFFIGVVITSVAGRSIKRFWERTISKLPIVRNIYPYTKQLTDFLFQERKTEFDRVVLVEYPRKGIFSMGFPTGEGHVPDVEEKVKGKVVSVFIPSSPTPFTGYTVFIEEHDMVPLEISVEEALRFCVTGGVIKPDEFLNEIETVKGKEREVDNA